MFKMKNFVFMEDWALLSSGSEFSDVFEVFKSSTLCSCGAFSSIFVSGAICNVSSGSGCGAVWAELFSCVVFSFVFSFGTTALPARPPYLFWFCLIWGFCGWTALFDALININIINNEN